MNEQSHLHSLQGQMAWRWERGTLWAVCRDQGSLEEKNGGAGPAKCAICFEGVLLAWDSFLPPPSRASESCHSPDGGDLQDKTALFWQVASWVAGSPFSHLLRPPRGLAIRCAHSPGIRSQAWVLPRPSVLRAQSHRVLRIPGVRLKEDEPCEPRKHSKCGAGLGRGWP